MTDYYRLDLIIVPLGLALIFNCLCLWSIVCKKIEYFKTSHYVFASNYKVVHSALKGFGAWQGGEKDWDLIIYLWVTIALYLFSLFFSFVYFSVFWFTWIFLMVNFILISVCIVTLIMIKRSKKNLFPNALPLNFSYKDVQKKLKNEHKMFLAADKRISKKRHDYIINKIRRIGSGLPTDVWKDWKGTDIEWKKYKFECLVKMIKKLQWSFMWTRKKYADNNIVVRYHLLKIVEKYSLENKKAYIM